MHRMMMQASEYLVALRVIDKNDAAIFRYGLEMMLLTIAEVASVLMIAAFVGNFVETFLYFLAFIPLRLLPVDTMPPPACAAIYFRWLYMVCLVCV